MMTCDEELMHRVGRDDLLAFQDLFDRYNSRLYRFLHYFVGDPDRAEDLLQEVFLRLWRGRQSFNGGQFSDWIYLIARRVAFDESDKAYNQAVLFSTLDESELDEVEAAGAVDPSDDLVHSIQVRAEVRAALRSLPPEQRVAIVMKECEGLTHQEIAEALGCTPTKARALTTRARAALRQKLKPLLNRVD